MDYLQKIIIDIELHNVEGIKECFSNGISPDHLYNDQPLIYELISEYTRSPRFKDCVRTFVEHGIHFQDKVLLAVLLDNANSLNKQLDADPGLIEKRYTLRSAYTPLHEVSLMHICAEYNHLSCAEVLVKHGADINAKAGLDEYGFGGQTPIFHTVNQNGNQSADMLQYLISRSADLGITVKGFIWGKSYPWATFIPAVNPLSYAMMGLLPQMHRNEKTISEVVMLLMKAAYGIDYVPPNVPNAYLKK